MGGRFTKYMPIKVEVNIFFRTDKFKRKTTTPTMLRVNNDACGLTTHAKNKRNFDFDTKKF